ncbi:MAG: DUF4352 domain-containing protein [Geodermatophilaceae bacterium]
MRSRIAVAGVLLGVLAVSACNTVVAGSGVLTGTPAGGPSPAATSGAQSSTPPTDAPTASAFQLGQTGTVTDENGAPLADITVADAVQTTDPPDEFSDPPQGVFLSATVTLTNIGEKVFSVAPFDFVVGFPDGSRIQYGDGSKGAFGYDNILPTTDLGPGETLVGEVVFDVDPDVAGPQILYLDLSGRALGAWMVP